ncbi:MAG TPA: OB-fold nucleic acid binding domain-containing protein [Candidatus Acidoferrales bacterium]
MKRLFVTDLAAGKPANSCFLVVAKDRRLTQKQSPYLALVLADRTGKINARVWDNADQFDPLFQAGDFIEVSGQAEGYQGRLQLKVQNLRRVASSEVEAGDFVRQSEKDPEALFAELVAILSEVRNPHLRRLLASVLEEREIAEKLKRAPAAKLMHHAYVGGLIEHIVSLCRLSQRVAEHYPELDLDLLLTASLLHDLGKIDELKVEPAIEYSTEGRLLGHIVLELELVNRKIDAIEGFPAALRRVVQHLIVSHHGQREFGSPEVPKFAEAIAFHFLDDLDSKLEAVRSALGELPPGEGWTSWNRALDRQLTDAKRLLGSAAGAQALSLLDEKKR